MFKVWKKFAASLKREGRRLAPVFGGVALLLSVTLPLAAVPSAALASGWCINFGGNPCPSSRMAAAYAFYQALGLEKTQFIGYYQDPNVWWIITPHYLCPTGYDCGTAPVTYVCPNNFYPSAQAIHGVCNDATGSGPRLPCGCNSGGSPLAGSGQPIDFISGNKRFSETDFENVGGSIILKRIFNSLAHGGANTWVPGLLSQPVSNPVGLGNWLYDFQFELQIVPNSSVPAVMLLFSPNGSVPAFQIQASGAVTPYSTGGYPNPQTDYTLAYSGPTPIPSNLTAQATNWTLTDSEDTVYSLLTFPDANSGGAFDVARPVQIRWRNGRSWQLSYGTSGELDQVTDQFGNSVSFTWAYGYSGVANFPQAIQTVTLPNQHSIQYTYATIGGPVGGASAPDLLTQVQYVDSGGVEDSTSYVYGNASCPYDVTAVLDDDGVQRWGASYNGLCMALTSSVSGAGVASATGSISGATLTTTAGGTGSLAAGQWVTGIGVAQGTFITGPASGGGFTVNASQTVSTTPLTAVPANVAVMNGSTSGNTLTVDTSPAQAGPALGIGYTIVGTAITRGSFVTAVLGGSPAQYTLSKSGTVADRALIGVPPAATFMGSISGTTLAVSSVSSGALAIGQSVTGPGVAANTTITAFAGSSGGVVNYVVSPSQSGFGSEVLYGVAPVAIATGTISGDTLTVTAISGGTLTVGQSVFGKGVAANTVITGIGTSGGGGRRLYGLAVLPADRRPDDAHGGSHSLE